jgi:hypothetical protein
MKEQNGIAERTQNWVIHSDIMIDGEYRNRFYSINRKDPKIEAEEYYGYPAP